MQLRSSSQCQTAVAFYNTHLQKADLQKSVMVQSI